MTNFNMATSNTAPRPTFIDIDLSVAREDQELNIFGSTFIFAMLEAFDGPTVKSTTKSVGELFIKQNGNDAQPLYLTGGRSYYMQATTKLFLTNEAQPGAMIRLLFTADGSQIIPFSTDIQAAGLEALLQNPNDLRSPANSPGENYYIGQYPATPIMLIDPSANPNGAIVRTFSGFASGINFALYSDTAAPSSSTDVTKRGLNYGYDGSGNGVLPLPMLIEPDNGLWVAGSTTAGHFQITWDLLT